MQIQLGVFVSEPWLVTVLALVAVAGDALLPFLPSGSLVIAAALLSLDHGGAPVALAVAVAAASFLGDLFVVALARGGSSRTHALLARHAGLASFAGRMRCHLARRLPSVTVAGRFVPAGRTVLGLTLGARPGQRARYLGWSAFGGLVWACYLVGLGVVNGMWFETRWIGFAMSTAVAVTLSTCLARSLRQRAGAERSPAMSSQVGHLRDSPGEVRADEPGETRPAACVVARYHARGSALGPHRGHEAVRPHRRATEGPVGSDPPLPSAHPGRNQDHEQQREVCSRTPVFLSVTAWAKVYRRVLTPAVELVAGEGTGAPGSARPSEGRRGGCGSASAVGGTVQTGDVRPHCRVGARVDRRVRAPARRLPSSVSRSRVRRNVMGGGERRRGRLMWPWPCSRTRLTLAVRRLSPQLRLDFRLSGTSFPWHRRC
ncbi:MULTISPECIES: hypothetical protein [unclassified Streptomyces]|uniref:DedA family protein n=1 Tax=unclassified Streptomyces TaxID=2593676 RepID=UPI0030778E33